MTLETQTATNLIAILLLLVTGVYVFLTWKISQANTRLLEETQRAFKEDRAPYIVARVAISQSVLVSLRIENLGRSPAVNLTLSLDRDFYRFGEYREDNNIRNFHAFQHEIPQFSPGEHFNFILSQGFNLENFRESLNLTPKILKLTAVYQFDGSQRVSRHVIDLNPYMNNSFQKSAAEKLGDIEGVMKKWSL
ncbi:hypothetical protein [Aurantimonas marina]|uniref:hypothetical protein n=1 Tax=Aurantimonas marina TaxID=2780508 RepID=UPI0019D21E02|nr:hypothetical protein [Aurantimonas marina]